jgi:PAS domain S-box-containing protein
MRRRVAERASADLPASPRLADAISRLDSNALLAAAFDASPDGLAVVTRDSCLVHINSAGSAMLPLASRGKPLSDCVPADFRVVLESALASAFAGRTGCIECQGSADASQTSWLELTVSPLSTTDGLYALVVCRDIGQRRQQEERAREAAKLEAIGRLTGGVAHDFNNILTVVIGNSELLAERLAADEEGRTLAEISLSAARAGADLTRMLLAYSRRQPLQPSEFCAADMLGEMRGLIERSLGGGIALEIEADGDPWGVRADRAQLASVLLNLALNARDAMPRGGRLGIQTRNVTLEAGDLTPGIAPGPYVMIAVSDTGTGIPAAILERAFEPFFTTKEVGKGSGLGLAMVQGFAHQSGGHVAIQSKPGDGTVVRLYLPRVQVQLRLPDMETESADLAARPGETVLVAEDNAAVRTLIVGQLEALGYAVTAAGDGKAALAALRQLERVDLLLTDIVMPGLDGLTLAERARRLRPDMKIVLTSGHAEQARNFTSQSALFGAFLAKPFTRHELARRVRTTLNGRV